MARRESPEAAVSRLSEENERLRSRLEKRLSWRSVLAVVLIALGVLLSPVAVVANGARAELMNTDRFVATLAPLVREPAIQILLVDEITSAIESQLDIDGIAADLFGGLGELGLSPRAAAALGLLQGPAVQGISSLIRTTATTFVESDAFATVWERSLRLSHAQFIGALEGEEGVTLVISDDGELGLRLAPLITAVRDQLVAQGFGLAAHIPAIDRTIVIAQSDALVNARTGLSVLDTAGIVLPIASLLLLAVGVAVARRRVRALVWASAGVALMMALLASGISIGRGLFVAGVSPNQLPADAASALYDAIVPFIYGGASLVGWLALLLAAVAYLFGPFRGAVALRGGVTRLVRGRDVSLDGPAQPTSQKEKLS